MKKILVLVVIVGFMFACGGPKDVIFEKLGLSSQLPSGWKADKEEDATKYSPLRVEIRKNDRRTLIISKYKLKVDNFEAMEKTISSLKNVTILSKEKLENGFGFIYKKRDKKLFVYFITFDDITYECIPNDFYYDEKDIPASIDIIKTIKKV